MRSAIGRPSLTRKAYCILLALAQGDLHGAEIGRRVQSMTEGRVHLWPATLYGTLEQLVEDGMIRELADPRDKPSSATDRQRHYRLTNAGRDLLTSETDHLASLVETARGSLANE
jgi:DNA-binding PadR family transcriptional regulator